MRFVFYTNSISPHQLPLARELVQRLGPDNYRYVYTTPQTAERKNLGWNLSDENWIVCEMDDPVACRELLESCDVLMSGIRDFALFAKRAASGKKTIYSSERWFKPIHVAAGLYFPGFLRLLHPRYFSYARKMAALIRGDNQFFYYPMGVWAKRDMEWACKLFRVPRECVRSKLHLWGYFVAPSAKKLTTNNQQLTTARALRVLWVGRMIYCKRVDTLIRAVSSLPNVMLDIYGTGTMMEKWRGLTEKLCSGGNSSSAIMFHPQVPITEVRSLMRSHDLYVLASNGEEGWGAVVSEALEEGMRVIGTYESGASATLLPESNLYHAGDWRRLAQILSAEVPHVEIGQWSAKAAADCLIKEVELV